MQWIHFLEASCKDLDSDAPKLRDILDDMKRFTHYTKKGYKFDAQAQFAMGWWFFTIHVQKEFIVNVVEYMHAKNPKIKNEHTLLDYIQDRLKERKSTMKLKFHGNRSIFAQYWTWLMR